MNEALTIECITYERIKNGSVYTGWTSQRCTLHSSNSSKFCVYNAKCTVEFNRAGDMSFVILPSNPNYSSIKIRRSEIVFKVNNYVIFVGYVSKISDNFYGERTVNCIGVMDYLKDSILRTNKYYRVNASAFSDLLTGDTVSSIGSAVYSGKGFIKQHNEQMGDCLWKHFTVIKEGTNFPTNFQLFTNNETTYDALFKKVIDDRGIYLKISFLDAGSSISKALHFFSDENTIKKYYVDNYHDIKGIEFGKNLLDCSRSYTTNSAVSCMFPLGATCDGDFEEVKDRVSIKPANDSIDYIVNEDAVSTYGRIFSVEIFDDITNSSMASLMKDKASKMLLEKMLGIESLEITAIDLYKLTSSQACTKIGDLLKIYSKAHSLNTDLICTKVLYDIDNPQNSKLYFGKTTSKLSDKLSTEIRLQKSGRYNYTAK